VLLAGNRDINKLRVVRELGGFPHPRTPAELLGDPPALLRWIFQTTMGAGEAFAMRQAELARSGPASDQEVMQSFQADLAPDGAHTRYLSLAQLGFRSGRALFVHGAVTAESLGSVPGRPGQETDLDAWVEALNAWYRSQVAAYVEGRLDADGTPGWQEVVAYQAPRRGSRLNQGSVVYGRLTDDLQNPHLPAEPVVEALLAQGVERLVVGHTPAGDVPTVLRARGFELVLADTSHGRVETGSQVLLEEERLTVRGFTSLDDGTRAELSYALRRGQPSQVGLVDAESGQLVKGPLTRGDVNLWKGLPGYTVQQVAISQEELEGRRLVPPPFEGPG